MKYIFMRPTWKTNTVCEWYEKHNTSIPSDLCSEIVLSKFREWFYKWVFK